jgi:hypothetical protein
MEWQNVFQAKALAHTSRFSSTHYFLLDALSFYEVNHKEEKDKQTGPQRKGGLMNSFGWVSLVLFKG